MAALPGDGAHPPGGGGEQGACQQEHHGAKYRCDVTSCEESALACPGGGEERAARYAEADVGVEEGPFVAAGAGED